MQYSEHLEHSSGYSSPPLHSVRQGYSRPDSPPGLIEDMSSDWLTLRKYQLCSACAHLQLHMRLS